MKLNSKVAQVLPLSIAIAALSCSSSDDDGTVTPQPVLPPSITALNTTVDDNSILFDSVEVVVDGVASTIAAADVVNIEVLAYQGSPLAFERTVVGQPTPDGGDETIPPALGERAAVIEDFVVNSAINNPGQVNGMTFQFVDASGVPTPITNGPGPDILMLEVGSPPGAPAPPMGMNTAVPGDPFVLRGVGADEGNAALFGSADYTQIGEDDFAMGMSFFLETIVTNPPNPEDALADLADLESADLTQVALVDLSLFAILIDLDTLGFAEGAVVDQLTILSTGTMFAVDPAMIVGFVR